MKFCLVLGDGRIYGEWKRWVLVWLDWNKLHYSLGNWIKDLKAYRCAYLSIGGEGFALEWFENL